jgi:hypothetical protein
MYVLPAVLLAGSPFGPGHPAQVNMAERWIFHVLFLHSNGNPD